VARRAGAGGSGVGLLRCGGLGGLAVVGRAGSSRRLCALCVSVVKPRATDRIESPQRHRGHRALATWPQPAVFPAARCGLAPCRAIRGRGVARPARPEPICAGVGVSRPGGIEPPSLCSSCLCGNKPLHDRPTETTTDAWRTQSVGHPTEPAVPTLADGRRGSGHRRPPCRLWNCTSGLGFVPISPERLLSVSYKSLYKRFDES